MTLVRRVTGKISRAVVRYASPGCKDWAEGLAREVEFIPGDWVALWWAMGSTKVLFDRREAPLRSLADVAERAQRFSESDHVGALNSVAMFVYAVMNAMIFLYSDSLQQRLGCGVVVIGSIYMGVDGLLQWRRRAPVPQSDEVLAWALYYKAELERRRERFHSGITKNYRFTWPLYCIGIVFSLEGGPGSHPVLTALLLSACVLVTPFLFPKMPTFQRQLDELDAILEEVR